VVDNSGTLLLVEDDQNDVQSTLAALSEGAFIARTGEEALDYLLRSATYRSQAAENPRTGLPALNAQLASAAEREL
jgi:hypothetical protein